MNPGDTSLGGPAGGFPATVWDDLRQAHSPSPEARRKALEGLCRQYWKPIYRHVRIAWAKSNEDAKELTQAFLLWLIEGDALKRYDPGRASFRAYLKSLLRHFVQHQDEALQRLKRGGGVEIFSLDEDPEGLSDKLEDPRTIDPEEAFDRAWRAAILSAALGRVRERLSREGSLGRLRLRVFEAYDLVPPSERPTHPVLAEKFGIKTTDVQNYLFSVREEVRTEVLAELSRTATGEDSLREEWNGFFDQR
jgi:RNA polymerase sigma factor (sigma-70 family)